MTERDAISTWQLGELLADLPVKLVQGDPAQTICELTDDSRQVQPGWLFIARAGAGGADGRSFIADAIARGAAAVLCEGPGCDVPSDVALLTAERVDQALAGRIAERFFGSPSRALRLIGVTGTNGKTTTAYVAQHLLSATGTPCGLIGTIQTDVGESTGPRTAALTTPGAIEFARLLAAMVRNGCKAAVAEVSSHALHQGRCDAFDFNVGIFTNLTGDHLDYHGTMDDYAAAKARLFELLGPSGWAVINADDPYAERMARDTQAKVIWTSLRESSCPPGREPDSDLVTPARRELHTRANIVVLCADGSRACFDGPWGSKDVTLPLVGRHNVCNALQAAAAANAVAPTSRSLRKALESCPSVPGRLERVTPAWPRVTLGADGTLPAVLVDYAHTHDALENVLLSLRPVTHGRLIVVFGCGGDRDRTKRPKMAAVAARLADKVFVTSDNPRTEDPDAIIEEILAGVSSVQRLQLEAIADRASAIRTAIDAARAGDTVLIAGKGHEDYQIVGTEKHHLDDREEAAAAMRDWRGPRSLAGTRRGSNA